MERNFLVISFKNLDDVTYNLRINDVSEDVTSEQALAIANKALEKNIIKYKGKSLTDHIGSKLEKLTVQDL